MPSTWSPAAGALLFSASASLLGFACSAPENEAHFAPVKMIFSAQASATTSASAAPPVLAATTPRPIQDPPDPEAQKLFRALLEQPAVGLSDETPPRVTALALGNTARGEARGLKPEGPPQLATLALGKRASRPVTVPAGACVTYLAQGGLGVGELDLFVSTGKGSDLKVLVQDVRGGPIAVIGGHDGCWSNPGKVPLEGELHVVVRRGQGVVLVQRFSR